jgi:hypothetical protein
LNVVKSLFYFKNVYRHTTQTQLDTFKCLLSCHWSFLIQFFDYFIWRYLSFIETIEFKKWSYSENWNVFVTFLHNMFTHVKKISIRMLPNKSFWAWVFDNSWNRSDYLTSKKSESVKTWPNKKNYSTREEELRNRWCFTSCNGNNFRFTKDN